MNRPRPEAVGERTSENGINARGDELQQFVGQWVAYSADGSRIVAYGKDLAELDRRVVEAGEDPEEVSFLLISDDAMIFSGAEFQ